MRGLSWLYLARRLRLHPRLDLMLNPVTPSAAFPVGFSRLWEAGTLAPPVKRSSCNGKLMAHLFFRYEAHLNTPNCRGSIAMQHTVTTLVRGRE